MPSILSPTLLARKPNPAPGREHASPPPARRVRQTASSLRPAGRILLDGAPVRSLASPAKVMLAVLPFVDLSRDPEESSCDGLTKEVITQIAQLNAKRLGVIARTSAMSFKGTAKPIAQIGRELGVGYVLEGSVRHEGGRVRISAQVVEARDQHHVWADSYEEDLTDILRAQQRVAEAVTRAVRA